MSIWGVIFGIVGARLYHDINEGWKPRNLGDPTRTGTGRSPCGRAG